MVRPASEEVRAECPRCSGTVPDLARFCHLCGTDLVRDDPGRKRSFACRPDELVESFALLSTVMPRTLGRPVRTYRLALGAALVLVSTATLAGALPLAVLLAAVSVPAVYLAYLHDARLWEVEPLRVVGLAFGLTLVLAVGWTSVRALLAGPAAQQVPSSTGPQAPSVLGFLVAGVLVPVVGELLREVGPLRLASRPLFDDVLDAATLGLLSGMAYATGDTLVARWALVTGAPLTSESRGPLLALLLLEGFVKPLVLGLATALALIRFSGVGEGYDGFTDGYFRGLGEAVLASVAFFGGTYLLGLVPDRGVSAVLSAMYGLALLAAVLVRVRAALHTSLLDGAVLWRLRYSPVGRDGVVTTCRCCQSGLGCRAAFCGACGTAVLAFTHLHGSGVRSGEEQSSESVGGST
jgi:hypothetical protein